MAGTKETCANGLCVCCPYGCTFVAPCILGIIAMAFTWSSTWGCHFLELGGSNTIGVGPWSVEDFNLLETIVDDDDDDGCISWDESDYLDMDMIDAPLKFTRAISMIGAFVGLIFWITLMFAGCMIIPPAVLKLMVPIFGLVAVCMLLTLVMMASDVCKDASDCQLSGGGVAAILAFFFWLSTSASIVFMKEKESEEKDTERAVPAKGEEPPEQPVNAEGNIIVEDETATKQSTKPDDGPEITQTEATGEDMAQPENMTSVEVSEADAKTPQE